MLKAQSCVLNTQEKKSNEKEPEMDIGSMENHRERENGSLVYPVYSRRSGGLSVGINLYPNRKVCTFDCAYCEIFPFLSDNNFSLALMETDLLETLKEAKEQGIPVRDICFSGNGEPTQSPDFPAALDLAFRIRDKEAPGAEMVLITNGTGLVYESIFELLSGAANRSAGQEGENSGLRIWLKLDAGTSAWYKVMSRSLISHELLIESIRSFAKRAPITLQTMICIVNEEAPSPVEAKAWEALVCDISMSAMDLRAVQIYGKARPAPEDPLATALPVEFLEARAESLRAVLASAGKDVPVRVYP